MNGISDLLKSEKGLAWLLTFAVASVFAYVGKLPIDTWVYLAIGGQAVYTAGKTAQGIWAPRSDSAPASKPEEK